MYCLDALTGDEIWKVAPGPNSRRVSGNGRVISPWAIRTSVVVEGDTAYCGAGVIPSEGVYVVAMKSQTGELIWKQEMKDLPAQGYMLASKSRLYVVTSRDTPIVLDTKTGERLYKVKGGTGGTYALLAGDTLLYGPSKTGDVNMVGQGQETLASFQGNHMIVAKPLSYLQSQDELSSLDRETYVELYAERNSVAGRKGSLEKQLKKARDEKKQDDIKRLDDEIAKVTAEYSRITAAMKDCLKWKTKCAVPFSLMLAGDTLIGGGDGEVIAIDAKTGNRRWNRQVPGKAYGLALSDGKLLVSTDQGTIHCFADGVADRTLDLGQQPVRHQAYQGIIQMPEQIPSEIHGPFTEFVAAGKVKVEWDTSEPMSSVVRFGVDMTSAREVADEELKTHHEIIVDGVQREVVYRFRVGGAAEDGRKVMSEAYRFDAFQDYLPVPLLASANWKAGGQISSVQQTVIEEAQKLGRGWALVVGATDGRLGFELARQTELSVVVIERDAAKAKRLREQFVAAGIYGARLSVHQQDFSQLEYGPFLANLIVSESMLEDGNLPVDLEHLFAALRPAGGRLVLAESVQWKSSGDHDRTWSKLGEQGLVVHQRQRLPNTGEWTHQYASADNSACSRDDQIQGDLKVQWWGKPGARPMPDRGNRNPPPVSANGRLYIQGNRTLFGLDAYNGTILWAKQIPTMRRANMPRDGSNMVAADEHVCVAIQDKCVAFDGQTGRRLKDFDVPEEMSVQRPGQEYNWGYVSRIESKLFGSAVRRGAQYLGDKGEWYEGFGDKDIAKVTSDAFFAKDAYTGRTHWFYANGQIINSTITIADGRIYFIESRSKAARDAESGRMTREVLQDQMLVCLNAVTGDVVWEKPYDFSKCQYVNYMTYASDTLLITGTDEKNVFHTYAFNGSDGEALWQHDAPMKKTHHTGQLAHPTIVGDRVYFNKHTYALRTGEVLGVHNFDWHGCGVMSASNHTVFSRYEYHGMLDLKTNERTELLGIRSGCWLSLIPSGGLLLAPETSAGCSCGHSIQTSIAYVPRALDPSTSVK